MKKPTKRYSYVEGFLAGQCVAYCEQVRLGSRLAGAINCDQAHVGELIRLVEQEGCKSKVISTGFGRACLWVYRYKFLKGVIDYLESVTENKTDSAFSIWAMGKLFGYADSEIAAYVEEHVTKRFR